MLLIRFVGLAARPFGPASKPDVAGRARLSAVKEVRMTTPRSARGKGKEAGPVTNEPAPEDSLEGYGGRGSSQDPQSGRMAGDRQGATGWRDRAYEGGEPDELTLFGTNLASAAWPAFLAAGIGAIVLGALLLAWPRETLAIVAVLIGVALIVTGILRLMDGFTSHEATGGKRVASVVVGLIAIVLGLYCIRHFHFTIRPTTTLATRLPPVA